MLHCVFCSFFVFTSFLCLQTCVQVGGIVTQAISRMEADVATRKEKEALEKLKEVEAKLAVNLPTMQPSKNWLDGLRSRKLWKSKSTSFTRAPDW